MATPKEDTLVPHHRHHTNPVVKVVTPLNNNITSHKGNPHTLKHNLQHPPMANSHHTDLQLSSPMEHRQTPSSHTTGLQLRNKPSNRMEHHPIPKPAMALPRAASLHIELLLLLNLPMGHLLALNPHMALLQTHNSLRINRNNSSRHSVEFSTKTLMDDPIKITNILLRLTMEVSHHRTVETCLNRSINTFRECTMPSILVVYMAIALQLHLYRWEAIQARTLHREDTTHHLAVMVDNSGGNLMEALT